MNRGGEPLLLRFFRAASAVSILLLFSMSVQAVHQPPFSLTLSTPAKTLKVGSDVIVNVGLKSICWHPVSVYRERHDPGTDYRIDITDADGHRLAKKDPDALGPFSGFFIMLIPGALMSEKIVLNEEFDLHKPGTYLVQMQRDVSCKTLFGSNVGNGIVTSNAIKFTISESDPNAVMIKVPDGDVIETK